VIWGERSVKPTRMLGLVVAFGVLSVIGFLAEPPNHEQRTISVTGTFSTTRSMPASRAYHP